MSPAGAFCALAVLLSIFLIPEFTWGDDELEENEAESEWEFSKQEHTSEDPPPVPEFKYTFETKPKCFPNVYYQYPPVVEIWHLSTKELVSHGVILSVFFVLSVCSKFTPNKTSPAPDLPNLGAKMQLMIDKMGVAVDRNLQYSVNENVACSEAKVFQEFIPHPKAYDQKAFFDFAIFNVTREFAYKDDLHIPVVQIGSTPYELLMKIRSANKDPEAGCVSAYFRHLSGFENNFNNLTPSNVQFILTGIPFVRDCIRRLCEFEFNGFKKWYTLEREDSSWKFEYHESCINDFKQNIDSMALCMADKRRKFEDIKPEENFFLPGLPVFCEGITVGLIARAIYQPLGHPDFWYVQTFLRIYPWLYHYRKIQNPLPYAYFIEEKGFVRDVLFSQTFTPPPETTEEERYHHYGRTVPMWRSNFSGSKDVPVFYSSVELVGRPNFAAICTLCFCAFFKFYLG